MPPSRSHSILDNFLGHPQHKIWTVVESQPEKWSFSNKNGLNILLEPSLNGPQEISLRQVGKSYDSKPASDMGIEINWQEEGVKGWPFWLHESCVSETFEHVYRKCLKYVHGSKFHISIVSILNMEDHNRSPGQPQDWQVDLSVWRIVRKNYEDNKYRPEPEKLLDRVVVYPTISDPPPTVIIFKQDLVTLHRNEDQNLLDIKMDIVLSRVYGIAENAVRAMQTKQLTKQQSLPSSAPNSDQLAPSSPLSRGSNASYKDREGSKEPASQRENTSLLGDDSPLSFFDTDSQEDLEGQVDNGEPSISSGSEGGEENDSSSASEPFVKQRAKERTAKIEDEESLNALRRGDTSGEDTLPK